MKHTRLALATLAIATLSLSHAQLIDLPSSSPPAAQLAAESIIEAINNEITHRVAVHRVAFETLWKNTRPGATPVAILAQLGTKAALVFQFSRENLEHIDRCAKLVGKTRVDFLSDAECTPPHALIFHSDGRVTINE